MLEEQKCSDTIYLNTAKTENKLEMRIQEELNEYIRDRREEGIDDYNAETILYELLAQAGIESAAITELWKTVEVHNFLREYLYEIEDFMEEYSDEIGDIDYKCFFDSIRYSPFTHIVYSCYEGVAERLGNRCGIHI